MVRHKSSKLKKHNGKSRSNDICRNLSECGLEMHALPRSLVRYSMVTTRQTKELYSLHEARKKVFLRSSSYVTLFKKSRQKRRTALKLGRNTFETLTHRSNGERGLKGTNKKFPLQKLLLLFTSIFDLKMPKTARLSIYQKM